MQEIEMNWYTKRKILYSSLLAVLVIAWFVFLLRGVIWAPVTCDDGKKNGIETGVDCGGSCLLVCKSDYKPLSVISSKAIKTGQDKYDVIVLLSNPNVKSAPKFINIQMDLYDDTGKNFRSIRGSVPGFTGEIIPIYNRDIEAKNISNIIVKLSDYEMYKSAGSYDIKLKNFSYVKNTNTTDIDAFYASPYKDDIKENFVSLLVAYNSLGNIIGFSEFTVPELVHDKTSKIFISLPYVVEGDIASLKFVPLLMKYEK